jgi:hypothetical protein
MRRLAYRLGDGPEQVVLTDHAGTYWALETGTHSERTQQAIPYRKGAVLHVDAKLTYNGVEHHVTGDMPARTRTRLAPIFIYYMGP